MRDTARGRRLWLAAVVATLMVASAARPASAQINISGRWNVCFLCHFICIGGPYGYVDVLEFTQNGTSLTLEGFSGIQWTGTIDSSTGAFTLQGAFGTVSGTGSEVAVSGSINSLDPIDFTGLRECDPTVPSTCDDGNPATTDTCCNTPVGSCTSYRAPSGFALSCTHDDPPVCLPTTTTTSSTTTSSSTSTSTTTTSTSTTTTTLIDRPVSGLLLKIRRASSGREKLAFVSKDPSFAFPAIGSADDPATGTPGGMRIDLFSQHEGTATLTVPAGAGSPGWVARDATVDTYRFKNTAAPGGISVVRTATLKAGKVLKLSANATGLPLLVAQGAVGIRITTGVLRSCALFDGSSSTLDVPGQFKARNAVASSLADCSDASLTP